MIAAALLALTAASPILAVAGLLAAGAWRDRRRQESVARQIRLIDALGAELGLIVAPLVRKPIGQPWRIDILVPVCRPVTVGRIVAIAHAVLTESGALRYELVLRPGSTHPVTSSDRTRRPATLRPVRPPARGRRGDRGSRGLALPARCCG